MNAPYPIYFDKRPVKVAFLVNPKTLSPQVFSIIFNFNFQKYNGRFNPIIFSDGKKLDKEAWDFLKSFDPDVIKCLFKPEKVLLQKIEDWLSPYIVELFDPASGHISGHGEYITIHQPSQDLISRVAPYHMWGKSTLVLFNIKELASEKLKEFIHFNFGTYDHWRREDLEQKAEKVDSKEIIDLTTPESVNDSLKQLGELRKNYLFPVQLSSVPNHSKEVDWSNNAEHFAVIVGDTPYELAHYWNRNLAVRHWLRPEICHIWLPTEVAEDEKLREGLQAFFKQRTARVGNDNNGKFIHFISFSLDEARLKKIADTLGATVWSGKKVEILDKKQFFPSYGQHDDYFHLKQGLELYQAYSEEENIPIDEPALPVGVHGGNWMLDAYIQYRPERYHYTNVRHWWRFPNRNHLARYVFPNKVSRIQRNGIPSVVMEFKSTFKQDEGNLTIKIPEDGDVIRGFIFGQNIPVYTGDPRAEIINRKDYLHTQRSDKGRYLQGLLGLFGGLGPAFHRFQEPYWRNVFELMSLSNAASETAKKVTIGNKLREELSTIPQNQTERDEEIEWLTEYILIRSKEHGKLGKEVRFQTFVDEQIKVVQESLKSQGKSAVIPKKRLADYTEGVTRDVKDLVEQNILLMGVRPHCTFCGYANWYHMDDIRQKAECRGCGSKFDLSPETPWFYRLNSLVQDGVSQHGLVPVLMALGELHNDARSSFIYSTSLDLFKRKGRGKYKHLGDLDIVCVMDGKFIMGEIKQSSSLFKKKHFEEALKLAKQIKPNVLVFSSFDGKQRRVITEGIKNLKEKLEPLGIEVLWLRNTPTVYIY